MKKRTRTAVAILAAILMTVSGANVAFARGGAGKGGACSGQGPGSGFRGALSQVQKAPTSQHRQHKTHQYREHNGDPAARSDNDRGPADPVPLRTRMQLRDPASHASAPSE